MIGDVLSVPAIPRTLTGNKLEAPVKRVLCGESAEQVTSRDSLADPEAIDAFVALASERTGALRTRTYEKTRPLRPREGKT